IVFSIGALFFSFICTYENRTRLATTLICVTVSLVLAILAVFVSYDAGYHWVIITTIMLVFFDSRSTMRFKIGYSILIILSLLLVTLISVTLPVLSEPSLAFIKYSSAMNIVLIGVVATTIAYFYRSKFADSEEKIIQYNKKLLQMANFDALTMLKNRFSINDHMEDLACSCARSGDSFFIAIGDVDFFKYINDQFGHNAGDYVLRTLASIFLGFMAEKGDVARWGGEEFLFTFEKTNSTQAFSDLNALRERIENYPFTYEESSFHVTMTFGMEKYQEYLGVENCISKADTKLYQGKNNGRNVVIS
ncbi:MAG: GGDEF domain-containing protein, partial [Clostridiales bacterium]|nr:GGDEF domain-containing protein [Clostridiales bacterium]